METKHTPGPWAQYVNSPRDIVILKMTSDGCEACEIARVSSGYDNARLIADAPIMLAALQLVAGEVSDNVRPTSADSYLPSDVVRAVIDAIEKATGSQP